MNIDGKENVEKRIKVFENNYYITYLYIFENKNKYRDTISKWKQTDFGTSITLTPEEQLEKHLDELVYRR